MTVTDHTAHQLWQLMAGAQIGTGTSRKVFAMVHTGEWVLKVEEDGKSFQNALEWMLWRALRHSRHARWLAPCKDISLDGSILVQRRTSAAAPSEFPKRMPLWLCDFKRDNFGMLDGRLVAHDYGLMHKELLNLRASLRDDVEWWRWESRNVEARRKDEDT